MPEDGSILLGPVDVSFGDGSSVVQGTVQCSAGIFELRHQITKDEGGGVLVLDGGQRGVEEIGTDTVVLRGLPRDVAMALSTVTYRPPKDWSSRVHGVVTLSMEIQTTDDSQVTEAIVVPMWPPIARHDSGVLKVTVVTQNR